MTIPNETPITLTLSVNDGCVLQTALQAAQREVLQESVAKVAEYAQRDQTYALSEHYTLVINRLAEYKRVEAVVSKALEGRLG